MISQNQLPVNSFLAKVNYADGNDVQIVLVKYYIGLLLGCKLATPVSWYGGLLKPLLKYCFSIRGQGQGCKRQAGAVSRVKTVYF